jgi:peptide/nickel transport system substrate-binding protein
VDRSPDGLTYEFVLRKGAKFHNGDPVTAEDVKFSFERYRGAASKAFKERVASVETPSPTACAFRLKAPWPDFLTFYSSATGAGWIVPKSTSRRSATRVSRRRRSAPALPVRLVHAGRGARAGGGRRYWRKTPP